MIVFSFLSRLRNVSSICLRFIDSKCERLILQSVLSMKHHLSRRTSVNRCLMNVIFLRHCLREPFWRKQIFGRRITISSIPRQIKSRRQNLLNQALQDFCRDTTSPSNKKRKSSSILLSLLIVKHLDSLYMINVSHYK